MSAYKNPWHPATEKADEGRLVWVVERHPKKRYPQSYSLHAGQVCYPRYRDDHADCPDWAVIQADDAGEGACMRFPEHFLNMDQTFCAWAYAEEFMPVPDFVLPNYLV